MNVRTLSALAAAVALSACGQHYSAYFDGTPTVASNPDGTQTVTAQAACSTMGLSKDCSVFSGYCLTAQWQDVAGVDGGTVSAKHCEDRLLQDGASFQLQVSSEGAVTQPGGSAVSVTVDPVPVEGKNIGVFGQTTELFTPQ